MNSKLLIRNGRIIDPANKVDKKADLLVVGEKIAEIGSVKSDCDNVIDGRVHLGSMYAEHQAGNRRPDQR